MMIETIIKTLVSYGKEHYKELSLYISALALIITPFQIRANRKNTVESSIYLEEWKSINKIISNSSIIKEYLKDIIGSAKNAQNSNITNGQNRKWFENGITKQLSDFNKHVSLSSESIAISEMQDFSSRYIDDNKIIRENLVWIDNDLNACKALLLDIRHTFYSEDKSRMKGTILSLAKSVEKLDSTIIQLNKLRNEKKEDIESGILTRTRRSIFRFCVNGYKKTKKIIKEIKKHTIHNK